MVVAIMGGNHVQVLAVVLVLAALSPAGLFLLVDSEVAPL